MMVTFYYFLKFVVVDYASKLKAKCQMLLESIQERDEAINRLEARLLNEARGSRNLEQHFQVRFSLPELI